MVERALIVTLMSTVFASAAAAHTGNLPPLRRVLCHRGNDGVAETIRVSPAVATVHLGHGDMLGACPEPVAVVDDRDKDEDGVIGSLDNCLRDPNSDQRDTDRDGYGNVCDADFDNDGSVTSRDIQRILKVLGRHPLKGADADGNEDLDLDGDGRIDLHDLHLATRQLGQKAGPRSDSDDDSVADLADPCIRTARSKMQIVPGCSALDLVTSPEAVTGDPADAATEVVDGIAPNPAFAVPVRDLNAALERIGEADASARAGDPCGAQRELGAAAASLRAALAEASRIVAVMDAEASRTANEDGDFTENEAFAIGRAYFLHRIGDAADGAASATMAFGRVCAAARPLRIRDIVVRTLDGRQQIELASGLLIGLAQPLRAEGGISVGGAIDLSGIVFTDNTGVADDLTADATNPNLTLMPCLQLRFVPVQRIPPEFAGPYVKHNPAGYEIDDGLYELEHGMAIAAEFTCSGPPQATLEYRRWSIDATLAYTNRSGNPVTDAFAVDLEAGDEPVRFRSDMDPDVPARLTARTYVQECILGVSPQPPDCDAKVLVEEREFMLEMHERGSLCEAMYEFTVVDVDDQQPFDWRPTWVKRLSGGGLGGIPGTFGAEGYALCPSDTSCFPTISPIVGSQPFAIHNTDFFPIYPSGLRSFIAFGATGVSQAAGVLWPHVTHERNGRDYQYSCTVPKVVRDAVGLCDRFETHDHECIAYAANGSCTQKSNHTTKVNAFYRLPFLSDNTGYTQGQGNLPPWDGTGGRPTHFGGYALDMGTSCDNDIRAARAGRVIAVEESLSIQKWYSEGDPANTNDDVNNCQMCLDAATPASSCCASHGNTCWTPGQSSAANYVLIRHQDGTIGQYVHMRKDTIVPELGDLVKRGAPIGVVGVVGNSSGPHLHWAERILADQCCTHLALFEAVNPSDPAQLLECYEPMPGDALRSNNLEP